MLKLKDLLPTNLDQEKSKFFASNFQYNPQFSYLKKISREDLEAYGRPKLKYTLLAKKILKESNKKRLRFYADPSQKNNNLTQNELVGLVTNYLEKYQLDNVFKVDFSKNYISRVAVNFPAKLIKIRLPISLCQDEVEATLNHEIGTHILRQMNYEQQPWFKKRKKYQLRNHLKTEEGLANLHSLLTEEFSLAGKAALNYLAVSLALKKSFVETFQFINSYLQNPERSFTWTFKKKRGISDSSKPGAYTKDMLYFEGFIDVLAYLRKNDYNPSKIYYGKVDLADLNKVERISPNYQPLLPHFYTDNPVAYKKRVKEIAKANLLFPFF